MHGNCCEQTAQNWDSETMPLCSGAPSMGDFETIVHVVAGCKLYYPRGVQDSK